MGVRYRKSKNIGGGFRVNLSKSGIGYSWGTKGFRVTKTSRGSIRSTFSIPGTGMSYVTERSANSIANSIMDSLANSPSVEASYRVDADNRYNPEIYSADTYYSLYNDRFNWELQKDSIKELECAIHRYGQNGDKYYKILKRYWLLVVITSLPSIAAILSMMQGHFSGWHILLSTPLVLGILGIITTKKRIDHNTIPIMQIEYELSALQESKHKLLMKTLVDTLECDLVAQVVDSNNHRIRKIAPIDVSDGHWQYMNCNIPTLHVSFEHWMDVFIDILPDRMFIGHYSSDTDMFGEILCKDIKAYAYDTTCNNNVCGYTPSDSNVIESNWRYRNKDGSQDRRYKDNYLESTFECSEVTITSEKNHFELRLLISNRSRAQKLCKIINMCATLKEEEPYIFRKSIQ